MITCPKCQHKNDASLKFCENCGAKLTLACPNCGNPVSLGAKFCGNCGYRLEAEADPQLERLKKLVPKEFAERLLSSRHGQMERERRIVTILFCDVKGSTALGEERDPEEVLEIMNGAFDVLIEPIYRYEGTLARLMGDAILAFFGAPIAHEDDPVRAVLAALDIQRRMPKFVSQLEYKYGVKSFAVRVGINTGLVVVGEVGSDLRVEYTAMGDAINVASRLENAAAPGTIVIADSTARLVRHAFELESLGGLELKGKAEPVQAYRVITRRETQGSARGIEGLYSPLVGRGRELQALETLIDELSHGRGQIVSVMGEAGLGKSRLLEEVRRRGDAETRGRGDAGTVSVSPSLRVSMSWLEGRSLSYQTSTPYAPFADLLGHFFDLHPEEKDLDKYDKIKAKIEELLPGPPIEFAPFLATLLGIELIGEDLDRVKYLMPPDLRERIFRAVEQLVEQVAVKQPLVVVFEDLHWADATSLDLIERLMPLTDRAMVMLIALFRPQRQDPSWRFNEVAAREYHHRYTAIQLEPLDDTSARQLVANLLEIEDLPEQVRGLILKKAEGNPFFVEEVIRSLLDAKLVVRENSHWRATREIANIQVPDTLAAVITARLDRLDEESRHTAQTAAVVGREFAFDVLADVYETPQMLDPALGNLQRRELIREKSRVPQRLYLFKHTVTQETAYASILMSKRRELHRRVAECLERVEPERVNDIAWHFLQAKEEARALPYLVAAGELAARGYSMPEAIGYFKQGVEVAKAGENLGLTRRAYEGLGNAQAFAFDIPGAVNTYQEMLQLGQRHQDVPIQVSAMNKLGNTLAMRMGQFPEAEKTLVEAERLARMHEDKIGLSETFFIRCGMCTAVGDFDGVVNVMEQAAQFGHELGVKDQIVAALDHVARSHLFMTRYEEAWKTAQEALPIAHEIHNRDLEAALLITMSAYHLRNGELDRAEQAAEEGADLAARIGALISNVYGAWSLGEIALMRGEYERAVSFHQHAVQSAFPFEQMLPFMSAMALASLGATYLEIGETFAVRAAGMHMHALELMQTPAGMAAGGTAWADIGFSYMGLGKLDEASELFQKGLDYPTMMGYLYKPLFLLGLALVALSRHDLAGARKWVNEARTFVQDRAMKHLYPLVAYADGQVQFASGEKGGALGQFKAAEALALEMRMRPMVWQSRAGAANVLTAMERAEEANAKRQEARKMIEEIAGLFTDQEMRATFVKSATSKLEMERHGDTETR